MQRWPAVSSGGSTWCSKIPIPNVTRHYNLWNLTRGKKFKKKKRKLFLFDILRGQMFFFEEDVTMTSVVLYFSPHFGTEVYKRIGQCSVGTSMAIFAMKYTKAT